MSYKPNDKMVEEFCKAGELYKQHRDYEERALGTPLTKEQKRWLARRLRSIGMFLKMGGQNMIASSFLSDSVYFSTL